MCGIKKIKTGVCPEGDTKVSVATKKSGRYGVVEKREMDKSDEKHCASDELVDEVSALGAIYDPTEIRFNACTTSRTQSYVSLSLNDHLPNDHNAGATTLTISLPYDYPKQGPDVVRLRAERLTKEQCEQVVGRVKDKVGGRDDGEVCLFEYIGGILEELGQLQEEKEEQIEERKMEKEWNVWHGQVMVEKKSVFQAHVAEIETLEDIESVLNQLKREKKIEDATHNMVAWRVGEREGEDDDGEKGAGKVMLFVLKQMKVMGMIVVVSRWYGGIKLGPSRFRIIKQITRDAIQNQKCSSNRRQ